MHLKILCSILKAADLILLIQWGQLYWAFSLGKAPWLKLLAHLTKFWYFVNATKSVVMNWYLTWTYLIS